MDRPKFSPQQANEISAIGAFILSHDSETTEASEMRIRMMEILRAPMFADKANREIWSVVLAITLDNVSPDAVLIASRLRSCIHNDSSAMIERLAVILTETPSWENGLSYAKNVLEFWRKQTIASALAEVSREIQGWDESKPFDPLEAMNKAFKAICESTDGPTVALLMSFLQDALEMKFNSDAPIITRIAKLDGNLNLFAPGELSILAARPSVGKSSLARQICANAAVKGDILIFSMEVPAKILSLQFACEMSGSVSYADYIKGRATESQMVELMRSADDPALTRLHVFTGPQVSVMDIALALTNLKVRGREVAAVVIDYLGLMHHPKADRHDLAVGNTTKTLKQLAIQRNVPIILLAQLNREVEKRGGASEGDRPRLADLRDSGNIEQDADNVLFLWRKERETEYQSVEPRTLTVAKHRNGQVFEIDLMFDKPRGRFYEVASAQTSPQPSEDWRTK
jgi:replicative DNA helicase